jgi:hypothetical protein
VDSLGSVVTTRLLGLILSNNLKWKDHVFSTKSKVCKLIFAIVLLKRAEVCAMTLWNIYYALLRSVMVFAYPAVCNMSASLFSELAAVERKVARIIGEPPPVDLKSFCEKLCLNFASRIKSEPLHPLRQLFELKPVHSSLTLRRANCVLRAPRCKTSRRQNSFLRFM